MKKYSKTLLLLIHTVLFLISPLYPSVDLFGYFEPQYTGGVYGEDYFQLSTNKLRVDLEYDNSAGVLFKGNFNFQQYNGTTGLNYLKLIPSYLSSGFSESLKSAYSLSLSDSVELDNAYIKLALEKFDLIIGKQQISLGTGYLWNPTDVFNIKDAVDPGYEQPGHNAVIMDIALSATSNMLLLYEPLDNFEESGKLFRIKANAGRFDCSFIAVQRVKKTTDFTDFTVKSRDRLLLGADLAGEFLGLGVWAEYAYNFIDSGIDYLEAVAGSDYTFRNGVYVMAEFYRNTEARKDYRNLDINDWLGFLSGERKAMSRDQMYASLNIPLGDLTTLSNAVLVSFYDPSCTLIPSLMYSISDNLELNAFFSIGTGSKIMANSRKYSTGGLLRLKLYY